MKIFLNNEFKINEIPVTCDLDLDKTGLYILRGANGVGKSSLFSYILKNKRSLSRNISFSTQEPLKTTSPLRVKDLLDIYKRQKSFCALKANQFFDQFQFSKHFDKEVNDLSGGENQILKNILCLSLDRDYYFLDEPFQYLDQVYVVQLETSIMETSKKKCCVLIEHNQNVFHHYKQIKMFYEQDSIKVYHND